MKNQRIKLFLPLFAAFLFAALPAVRAGGPLEDSRMDKAGDWFAALGKSGAEKNQFLLRRKIERRAEKAQKAAREAARNAGKNAGKMAKDAEKAAKETRKKNGPKTVDP